MPLQYKSGLGTWLGDRRRQIVNKLMMMGLINLNNRLEFFNARLETSGRLTGELISDISWREAHLGIFHHH